MDIYALRDPNTMIVRYVGASKNPRKRFSAHVKDTANTHKVAWIRSLGNDKPKMIVLEKNLDDDDWCGRETFWIQYFRKHGCDLTNATDGGEGSPNPSEETRRKMRVAKIGKYPSPETRLKLSIAQRKRTCSEETREKIRKSNTGKKHSAETIEKLRVLNKGKPPPMAGRHHSDESRIKIGMASRGRILSLETRRKMSISKKGKSPWIKGRHHSDETRRKMSESHIRNGGNVGRIHSEESRKHMSLAHIGKKLSLEIRLKMSAYRKGRKMTPEARENMRESYRKRHSTNNLSIPSVGVVG